jgi:phosphoribosyl 1,2-cyclic phosphodiesterase
MDSSAKLQVKFWGVRGSIPTPEIGAMTYGGNTACLEVRYGNQAPLILDTGSGARRLGMQLCREAKDAPIEAHVLFTHFHWDHIHGLPFFGPLYKPDNVIKFYSSRKPGELRSILENQMRAPYFPVNMPVVPCHYECSQIGPDGMSWGDLCIRPFPLCHPGGATGYRIQSSSGCIVYASDHEHGDQASDATLTRFAAGADILIYDAQYTPEEYLNKRGWGHSTFQAGIRIAKEAGVRQLVLFHHDPGHEDEAMDQIVERASEAFENTKGAREGVVYSV